jgi:hypothetical protein
MLGQEVLWFRTESRRRTAGDLSAGQQGVADVVHQDQHLNRVDLAQLDGLVS